jgi:hypothetical protein
MREPGEHALIKLRSTALDWRIVGGEVVILDGEQSRYLSVNASGAVLWPLLARGSHPSELTGAVVQAFGVSEDRAEADVRTFLGSLSDLGLLAPGAGGEGEDPVDDWT